MTKNRIFSLISLIVLSVAALCAQDKPYYLPGEGMYLVGQTSRGVTPVTEPTIVTQAYQSRLVVKNVDLAAVKAGSKSYNLSDRIEDDVLDMVSFMGIGEAYDLTVRNLEGDAYHLGDNAPKKTWNRTHLIAAYPKWQGHSSMPLAMYDQWDCPLSYAPDPTLSSGKANAVVVDFGSPHEGLVANAIDFCLVASDKCKRDARFVVTLAVYDKKGTTIENRFEQEVVLSDLPVVATEGGATRYSVRIPLGSGAEVINTRFTVKVSGFAESGVEAWLPRAIDHTGIYPSHTFYNEDDNENEDLKGWTEATDAACINVEGYFNYLGTWGWWDGKYERGEVVATADLVQIYYDPSDPEWPGEYFMGEASFPLECTFGSGDITIYDMPEWINNISYDDSQWKEYGCVQITLSADALPEGETGRNGKVVLCTKDGASFYTIYIRQGAAWFDMPGTDDDDLLPVKDVTGLGYDYYYPTDANGKYMKDEDGNYIRNDKYDTMINAKLTPPDSQGEGGDRVTVMYFWYDEPFTSIDYQGGARVVNATTGMEVGISSVAFKTGGDHHRKNVIELRLSTDSYINSAEYHQGEYEVTLPARIAMTADGKFNAGYTFRFTYGDPAKAYNPGELALDDYLGDYKAVTEKGEVENNESFTLTKEGANYYITNLCGSALRIPVQANFANYLLPATSNEEGEAFGHPRGGSVSAGFVVEKGKYYIYLDAFKLTLPGQDSYVGGMTNYRKQTSTGVNVNVNDNQDGATYDLQGRSYARQPQSRGLYISAQKKVMR